MSQSHKDVDLKQNQKVVEFFLQNFYTSVDTRLQNLVSTTFRFSVDGGPEIDFEAYVKRKNYMQTSINFHFDEPTTEDDIYFKSRFTVSVPRIDQSVLYCGGEMTFLVVRNLIERATVTYETGGDNEVVQEAIKNNRQLNDIASFI